MAISAKTTELELTNASDGLSALRRQYDTGPVQLTDAPDAPYDRHLSFDHVVDPATASPRQPYEALARSVRDVLRSDGSARSRSTSASGPSASTTSRWSSSSAASRRFVLPVERVPDSRPRVARASRGRSGAGRVLPAARDGARGAPLLRYRGGIDAQAAGARVARQHPAVAECVEQCAILCDGDKLDVPAEALPVRRNRQAVDTMHGMFDETPTLEEVKKRYISHLLRTTHGTMPRAAAILDVDRRSLYRMVT